MPTTPPSPQPGRDPRPEGRQGPDAEGFREKPRKRRRVFLWVFLAIQLLFLVWVITGAASAGGTPEDCGSLDTTTCNEAENFGTALGVGLIIALWAAADVILGITYAVYRLSRRNRRPTRV
ncbi:hypothetical protein [Streptomyces cavernicola]|uniref:Uncharacterized protein n=1 Tax=Streptomyces cavernicola TaxID=3043613 RepID=A0ABT6S7I5_9ACTN|nr:hypothetical protein [Streptomyces sp. B-S-A6]MDI3403839.1 hypothetical protein [Streptomyces sp. B-S-A6]